MKDTPQRVVIGIVENNAGQLLLTKRRPGVHLENYWEFPGGKVEKQESFKVALRRELHEEIGIHVSQVQKIIDFECQYDDRRIHFQVYKVLDYLLDISNREHQPLNWVLYNELDIHQMPSANTVIIDALCLPSLYMIADQQSMTSNILLDVVKKNLEADIKLIQYRAHGVGRSEYIAMAKDIYDLCQQHGAKMVCNCALEWLDEFPAHGVHLTSSHLAEVCESASYLNKYPYFSASCHTPEEVELANQMKVRCILIGPVHTTCTHPDATSLEWEGFNRLCRVANMPVYALGGVGANEVASAIAHGAQGVAGIRTFF